jgi:hypothetical protein
MGINAPVLDRTFLPRKIEAEIPQKLRSNSDEKPADHTDMIAPCTPYKICRYYFTIFIP